MPSATLQLSEPFLRVLALAQLAKAQPPSFPSAQLPATSLLPACMPREMLAFGGGLGGLAAMASADGVFKLASRASAADSTWRT